MYKRLLNRYYTLSQQCFERKINRGQSSSVIDGVCLMAHHVSDVHLPDSPSTCQCTLASFKDCISRYITNGYTFVSMADGMNFIAKHSKKKFVVLTFDDVPDDMYTNAFPYLKEAQIPFTIFLSQKYIDAPGYLSIKQIKELIESDLCTIGSHTMSHTMLRTTTNKQYEIKEAKDSLEALLGLPIDFFAYPYGSLLAVDRKSIRLAKKYYKAAFSTMYGTLNDVSSKYTWFLPRKYI